MKPRTEWWINPCRGPWWHRGERRWIMGAELATMGGSSCAVVRTYATALRVARAAQAVEDCAVDVDRVRTVRSGREVRTHGWTIPPRGVA